MYTSFITDDRNRRRLFFRRSICQTKSDDWVGHLNTILTRGGGNLSDPIFKSSNARGLPGGGGGGGMLKFRFDRRITATIFDILVVFVFSESCFYTSISQQCFINWENSENYSAARLSKVLVSLNMLFRSFNMFGFLRDENVRFPIQT